MTRVVVRSRVGPDGVLHVDVPLGEAEANREVVVTVEDAPAASRMDDEAWLKAFWAVAGSITDPTFERHPQGEYEQRDELP
jgi:hypothetical protein